LWGVSHNVLGSAGCQPAVVGRLPTIIERSSFSASRRKEQASCLRSPESKRLRIFQQLDHTLQ
jgi:hypothetical protein